MKKPHTKGRPQQAANLKIILDALTKAKERDVADERRRLRDSFAASALIGLLSRAPEPERGFVAEMSEEAFHYADAMMKERNIDRRR